MFEVSLKVSIRVIYCFLSKASDNKSSSSVSKMLINIYWKGLDRQNAPKLGTKIMIL